MGERNIVALRKSVSQVHAEGDRQGPLTVNKGTVNLMATLVQDFRRLYLFYLSYVTQRDGHRVHRNRRLISCTITKYMWRGVE
jgi:hypothetical protein